MSIQQMLLGVGAKVKTYLDDVYKNFLYIGNDTSNRDIVNGIDLSSRGGFVWTKNRDSGSSVSYTHLTLPTICSV